MNIEKNSAVILKGIGGRYTVRDDNGTLIDCQARGVFRHKNISPLCGDRVNFSLLPDNTGRLEELLPRRNEFIRPPVCNIDVLAIIVSETIPRTDPYLIDRLTAIAASKNVEVFIIVNKIDSAPEYRLTDIYTASGYRVFRTSAITGEGLRELSEAIVGKTVVFTGNSGVGKSSLINFIEPNLELNTGEVSKKLGRGRHTTRHVELISISTGAIIVDTPGFSSLDACEDIPCEKLGEAFPEFAQYLDDCKFSGCNHINVQSCAVTEALKRGLIQTSRYESYERIYKESASKPKQYNNNNK